MHSRYRRQLADTASGGQQVLIDLQARRLFCKNGACTKATFAEQTPSHLGKPCNQGRRWHDSVVSVQVVCPEYRVVLLVMH